MKITIHNGDQFYAGPHGCLLRILVLSIAVVIGAMLLPGIEVETVGAVILTAIVISLTNNIIRPILIVIALPMIAITLGLFLFVINAIIILMASAIVKGFHVDAFGSALLFSLILMAVNYLLELPNRYFNRQHPRRRPPDDSDDEGFTPYEEVNE